MTPLSFRFLKVLSVAGAAALVVVACGGGGNTNTGLAKDQTYKFPILGDFGTLDPSMLDAETDSEIAQNIFNGVVKFDNELNIVPDIASAMPTVSSDNLTYTFPLRHDVTFSNGDKLTAKDFIYSWSRAAAMQGGYSYIMGAIKGYDVVSQNKTAGAALEAKLEANDPSVILSGLTAPDDYTLKVQLSAPAGWFLSAAALEATVMMVVDQKAVKTDFDNWWTKPETLIGTGAFKMTARVANQSVDFAAVPNWWGSPKPTLTKVHLDVLQSASSAITAYEQGTYDAYGFGGYSNAPIADILRIQGTPNEKDQLLLHPKVRTTWVSFNMVSDSSRHAKGPFTLDGGQAAHDLRLAFALAIDKDKLVDVVCHKIICSAATGGLITKGLTGYLGDNADPLAKFDPTKAKSLLKGADPTGAKTAHLTYVYDPNNPLNKDVGVFIQDQWQTNLGVHVDLLAVDHSPFIKARLKGDYVLSRDGWQADYNHPQDWYDSLWGTALGCPDANCTSGYATKAYDDLLKKADQEPLDQAVPDYQKLGQMLIDDVAYIPLYYSVGAFLIKPYMKGAGTNNFFDYWWNQISIQSH
ncbi:MAG: peptide ABC transporter substrate-binding protein [Chloroflexi bacterium]|nr:MAG: peptide ABC transporter substrate-binding protein [Chloroflexota bacterium]